VVVVSLDCRVPGHCSACAVALKLSSLVGETAEDVVCMDHLDEHHHHLIDKGRPEAVVEGMRIRLHPLWSCLRKDLLLRG